MSNDSKNDVLELLLSSGEKISLEISQDAHLVSPYNFILRFIGKRGAIHLHVPLGKQDINAIRGLLARGIYICDAHIPSAIPELEKGR